MKMFLMKLTTFILILMNPYLTAGTGFEIKQSCRRKMKMLLVDSVMRLDRSRKHQVGLSLGPKFQC